MAKIITKYKKFLELNKYDDEILSDENNGLRFFQIENSVITPSVSLLIDDETYKKILKKLKFDIDFLTYYNSYGRAMNACLFFKLCINDTDETDFGEVLIYLIEKDDVENTYEVRFFLDRDNVSFICYGETGLKNCIKYNVLYNEELENKIFYNQVLKLLDKDSFKTLMENIDFNKVVWYNSYLYYDYGIKNNLIDVSNINMLSNLWFLVEKGFLTKEEFVNKHPNWFLLKDNEVYIRYTKGNLTDLSFMFSKNDSSHENTDSRNFIEKINDYWNDIGHHDKFNDLYLDNLKPETIKIIEDYIQKIYNDLDDEEKEEFNDYDNWEEKVENLDCLSELKNAIELGFSDAQTSADYDEAYDACIKPILNLFDMESLIRDENDNYIFLLKKDFLIRFDTYFCGDYETSYYKNKINENLIDRWFEIINNNEDSVEFLEIDFPYYGFQGSIDKDELHERIDERISEI